MPGQYWPSCIVAGVSATSLLTRSEGFARPVYGLLGLVILSGCVRFWSCSEASLPPPAFGERGHAASRVGASIGPFAPLEGLKARSRRTHANLLQPRPRLLLLPARLKLRLRRFQRCYAVSGANSPVSKQTNADGRKSRGAGECAYLCWRITKPAPRTVCSKSCVKPLSIFDRRREICTSMTLVCGSK